MDHSFKRDGVTIFQGDCRDVLRSLPAESVQCCVTSPPYWNLRDYNVDGQIGLEATPAEFVEKMVGLFGEVRRVLHPSGTLWLNLGDCFASSGVMGSSAGLDEWARKNSGQKDNGPKCGQRKTGRAPTPVGLKPKDLCMIPWRVFLALQADGWYLRSIICWAKKCLSGGTILYAKTQKGIMPAMLKDLVRLDPKTVQLWDGTKWTQVVGWSKTLPDTAARNGRAKIRRKRHRGESPGLIGELEIELRSGERIGCTSNHLWPTIRGEVYASDLKVGDTLLKAILPAPDKPAMPQLLEDEAIGWLCGFYLAEGCSVEKGIAFSIHADEHEYADRITRIAESLGGSASFRKGNGKSAVITVYSRVLAEVCRNYISGTNCYNKHLSNACWQRSNGFLRHLLRGYLDGDGHKRTDTDEWRIGFCNNDSLASDLRTVAARVGMSLRLKRTQHQCKGKSFPGWRGSLRDGDDRIQSDAQIVAIRHSRARVYWDVAVADYPNWFCLGSGIISHNSPMPESVTDRPTNSWEPIALLTRNAKYFYDAVAVAEESDGHGSGNKAKRWGTNHVTERNAGDGAIERHSSIPWEGGQETRNMRNVWHLGPEPYPDAHFATFPTEIPRRAIKAGTSEHGCCPACRAPYKRIVDKTKLTRERPNEYTKRTGQDGTGNSCANTVAGVASRTTGWEATCKCNAGQPVPCRVLDPFFGSGTTGEVAQELGCECWGIELNGEYIELAKARFKQRNFLVGK